MGKQPSVALYFARGLDAVNNLTGIARTRVNERLQNGAGQLALLSRLHVPKARTRLVLTFM
jgi:hypothetical protein